MANHNASTDLLNKAVVSPCRTIDFVAGERVERTLPWVMVRFGGQTVDYVAPIGAVGVAADFGGVYPIEGTPQVMRNKAFPHEEATFSSGAGLSSTDITKNDAQRPGPVGVFFIGSV